MNSLKRYVIFKLIQSSIDEEIMYEQLKESDDIIFGPDFLIVLLSFVEKYVKTNKLDKKQLSRLMDIVNHIRYNSKSYNSLFNDIIISINSSDCSRVFEYYLDNYMVRFQGHDFIKNLTPSRRGETIFKIKESISKDYVYLIMLTEISEEIDFINFLENCVLEEYFLLSINQIIYEFPDMLDNPTFLRRLKMVLLENLRQINNISDKKEKRIILKESKFYMKHLKEE